MGSRFRYSGKTEFQSTMIRAQQQTRANENKSTFERRPSQRFASRRSRMDRTRPNITSSSSASSAVNNSTTTTTTANNHKNNATSSSNSNVVHSDGNNTSSPANNAIEPTNSSQVNQSKQTSNDTPQGTVKPNIVINSGSSRHPILQSKPVKPPTVPPGAPYGISMQTKQTTNNSVSINNNNIHHYLKDRQVTEFSDCADLLVSKSSQEHAQPTNQNSSFSAHVHSKSQPNVPIKSHHYINYKPPDSQPPPPPPPKPFEHKSHRDQPTRIINSEEEQQAAAEASIVPARKPSRLACSFSSEQYPEANHHHNGSIHHNKHYQQQGEVINSSSMPPPPPPPHTMPRSVSNQVLTNQTNNKQQLVNHSQSSIIKPICVTEL